MAHPIIEVAETLTPLIRELRVETEENRRLADPIVEKLRSSGLTRMALAKEFDGLAVPPIESLKVYELLAAAEPSVAWIVWNCSLVTFLSRHMSPRLREEIYSDSRHLFAQSTRPMGTAVDDGDGFTVSGRWSLVSGCELADWLFLTCQIKGKDGSLPGDGEMPQTMFVVVEKNDCKIVDTWTSGGLRGSGSHDVEVQDVHVPSYRCFSFADSHNIDSSIARLPAFCMLNAIFAAQVLGIAQHALDTVTETGKTSVTPGPMPDLRDRADAQAGIAAHTYALEAARNNVYLHVEQLWARVDAGVETGVEEISCVYGASMHAIKVSRQAMDEMHALGGTRALYTSSPLERHHRDMHAMLRHIVAQQMWSEDTGRVLFGMEPVIPIYVL